MRGRRIGKARSTRGGALIIALLVVLVLTIIGIGVAYFTQLEDQTSGNTRLAKTAFYAAETGLRTGEQALTDAEALAATATELVSYTGGTAVALPGGGRQGVPLYVRGAVYDRIVLRAATGTSDVATFTLYVRNNVEDPANSAIADADKIINLVSVGQVWTTRGVDGAGLPIPDRLLATKILEEQIELSRFGRSFSDQEGADAGGTNTGIVQQESGGAP